MSELTSEFDRAMWEIYHRAKAECRYDANRFKQMLCDHGGVETASRLLDAPEVSDGFTALWEHNRLDLTVEAYVLRRSEFHQLFTPEQLAKARERLDKLGFRA